jgi:hypothetical protein
MPRKKAVDGEKLIKAVEQGLSSKEIMAKFGLKTLAQLKALYIDALSQTGKIKPIVTSRRSAGAPAPKTKVLKVNKRGSLIVSREMIDEMGFAIGDVFSVGKSLAGVSLKKQ